MPIVRNGGAGGGSSLSNGAVVQFSGVRPSPLPALNSRTQLYAADAPVNAHAFRYYRLYITSSFTGGNGTTVGEMGLAETVGGSNTALSQTYSASSTWALDPTATAAKAFDGTSTTYWGSDFASSAFPAWLKVDYGSTAGNWKAINELSITARSDNGGQAPYDFKLQGSDDDSSWTDLLTQTAVAFSNGETKTFAVTSGGASSDAIVGSTSLSFAPSATLTGTGALSGSSALTLTPSAALAGQGDVSGSSSVTLAPSGTVTGKGAITGSSSVVFAPSATLAGSGAVVGSAAVTLAGSGTVLGSGLLTGSSTVVLAASGAVLGRGALAGSTALTFVLAGNTGGAVAISGSGSFGFASTGSLAGGGAVVGASSIGFAGTGSITGRGAVSGASVISLLLSGNLQSLAPSIWTVQPPTTGTWVNDNGPPFDGGEFDIGLFDASAEWLPQATAAGSWSVVHAAAAGLFDDALFDEAMFDASEADDWTVLTPSTGTWG